MTQAPEASGGMRARISERTFRKDKWWQTLRTVAVGLMIRVLYATVRMFTGQWYFVPQYHYLTPFYSPCVSGECVPGSSTLNHWFPAVPLIIPCASCRCILRRPAQAAVYLLTVTAQPCPGGKDFSQQMLEKLLDHPDAVTLRFSRWALGFRFASDGRVGPLVVAAEHPLDDALFCLESQMTHILIHRIARFSTRDLVDRVVLLSRAATPLGGLRQGAATGEPDSPHAPKARHCGYPSRETREVGEANFCQGHDVHPGATCHSPAIMATF
jgi:hypothetical protein